MTPNARRRGPRRMLPARCGTRRGCGPPRHLGPARHMATAGAAEAALARASASAARDVRGGRPREPRPRGRSARDARHDRRPGFAPGAPRQIAHGRDGVAPHMDEALPGGSSPTSPRGRFRTRLAVQGPSPSAGIHGRPPRPRRVGVPADGHARGAGPSGVPRNPGACPPAHPAETSGNSGGGDRRRPRNAGGPPTPPVRSASRPAPPHASRPRGETALIVASRPPRARRWRRRRGMGGHRGRGRGRRIAGTAPGSPGRACGGCAPSPPDTRRGCPRAANPGAGRPARAGWPRAGRRCPPGSGRGPGRGPRDRRRRTPPTTRRPRAGRLPPGRGARARRGVAPRP